CSCPGIFRCPAPLGDPDGLPVARTNHPELGLKVLSCVDGSLERDPVRLPIIRVDKIRHAFYAAITGVEIRAQQIDSAARERRYLGFGVRVECGHAAGFERGHEALLAFVESSLGVFALGNVSEGDDYALDAVLHASVR